MSNVLFDEARKQYHTALLAGVLTVDASGIPSNADKHSNPSVQIAKGITNILQTQVGQRQAGQTSGRNFETITADFLKATFLQLQHIRPGRWEVTDEVHKIERFEQYKHLALLNEIAQQIQQLSAIIGQDYLIKPDIVIFQHPWSDDELNTPNQIVNENVAKYSDMRAINNGSPILHASVSAKWTIRSDRAQNSRSEALNLIRNRKGHLPHVVVVTAEPSPSRLTSIALGTGDIDCVYHFALDELQASVEQYGSEDAKEILNTMIEGKRLKDISDLPLDLTT